MKKTAIFITVLFLVFCSTGCLYLLFPSTLRGITSEEPYNSYCGRRLQLKHPMNLWNWGGYYSLNEINAQASDIDFPSAPELFLYLPTGTEVILTDYYCSKDYALLFFVKKTAFKVMGKVILPDQNKELEFRYIWGRDNYLHRAPWEGEDIPEKRYVGSSGKSYRPQVTR